MASLIVISVTLSAAASAGTVHVLADPDTPQVGPVLSELRAADERSSFALQTLDALGEQRDQPTIVLSLRDEAVLRAMRASGCAPSPDLRPEGFSLRRCDREGRPVLWVAGFDAAGLLYGGFELAEQLALFGWEGIRDTD